MTHVGSKDFYKPWKTNLALQSGSTCLEWNLIIRAMMIMEFRINIREVVGGAWAVMLFKTNISKKVISS